MTKISRGRMSIVGPGFVMAVAILSAIGVLAYRNMAAMSESARWVDRTQEVIWEFGALLSAVRDAETGQRGFTITGDRSFLEPHDRAVGQVEDRLSSLQDLTRDEPRQQERLAAVARLVHEKLAELEGVIALRSTRGFEAAAEKIRAGKGKELMDAIRGQVAEAQDEERVLLKERTGQAESATRMTQRTLVAGAVVSLTVLLLVFLLLRREIAERRRAEEALRAGEEQFHQLFEDDLTGDFLSTPDGKILLCNAAFAAVFGFSRAVEAVGTSIVDRYLDPTERKSLVERLRTERRIERLEVWRKRRDGQPIHIIENLVGRFDEQGRLYQVKGYIFEDTQRKQAEEALRESEERLHLALGAARMGAWQWEVGTQHVTWSPELYGLLGYEPGRVTPTHEAFRRRIHPQDLARWEQAVRDSMERCEDYACEFRVVWADGSVHWVEARGQYAYATDASAAETMWMRGVLSDIEQRKQAEEALRELTRTLESQVTQRTAELQRRTRQLQKLTLEMSKAEDQERERLAHILHDDLQQELAAAKFHLSVVRSRVLHDSSLHELTAQVDAMLKDAIAKSRSLSHELSPAVLRQDDFAEILSWLANEMQAKHGLAVHVQGRARVPSDPIKAFLYRTAQELLFNAVKHAQVGEARVRVRSCAAYVCLAVSDRGRGFDPGTLGEAAGFGLLSIRERIELLGGRMKIRSAPGRGSTFFVIVPNSEAAPPLSGRTEGAARATAQDDGRLRVVLADDHDIVRQGLAALLSEEGTVKVVGEATNGREAVELAERLHPDVVIMDVRMPVLSGEEATRRIKRELPQTRIVSLSMREEPETREKMRAAGAESYVLKTAPYKELLAAIHGEESAA